MKDGIILDEAGSSGNGKKWSDLGSTWEGELRRLADGSGTRVGGKIRNDSKVWGWFNRKGGVATEEMGRAGNEGGESVLLLGHGLWM